MFLCRSGTGFESEAQKVRVSLPAVSPSGLPFFLARDKGFFEDEGLEVQLLVMAAPIANLTLIAGEVSFSTLPVSGIMAIVRGAPLVVLYTVSERPLSYPNRGTGGQQDRRPQG